MPPPFSTSSFVGHPQPSFSGPFPGYKKLGINHGFKPVYESGFEGATDYEDKFIDKKQVVVQSGSSVQNHVHHHFHHGDENVGISPLIGTRPISNTDFNHYGYGNSGSSYNDFEQYKKNFKIKSPSSGNGLSGLSSNNYADRYSLYEKPKAHSIYDGSNNGKGLSHTDKQFNSGLESHNGFGNDNFGNNGHGSSNRFLPNNGFESNEFEQGLENGLIGSNYDNCICVPHDRCATLNQAGRKDDLYLPIDPRSLGKNIEADTEELVITNGKGKMSVVKVPKGVNETDELKHQKNEENEAPEMMKTEKNENAFSELKRIRREVDNTFNHEEQKNEAESVSIS